MPLTIKRKAQRQMQEDFPQGEKILVPFTYETKKSGIGRQENIPGSGMRGNCPWKRKKKTVSSSL